MSSDLVSAVIPAFDRPNRTQRAIESVAQQTYDRIELIVVDDGSTPPLEDFLDLPNEQVADVRLIRLDKNQGANVARNTGIKAANGDYIAFLDSDDEWHPEKIERQATALQNDGQGASYTSVRQVDSSGNLNGIREATHSGDIRPHLLRGNAIGTFSSILISQAAIDRVGYPDPEMPCWQDWEWYLRLSESVDFTAVDEPLVTRHNEGGQISRSFTPKQEQAFPAVRSRLLDVAASDAEKRTALAHLNYELGYSALVNQEYRIARFRFARAIRLRPLARKPYPYLAASGPHYSLARQLKRSVVRIAN